MQGRVLCFSRLAKHLTRFLRASPYRYFVLGPKHHVPDASCKTVQREIYNALPLTVDPDVSHNRPPSDQPQLMPPVFTIGDLVSKPPKRSSIRPPKSRVSSPKLSPPTPTKSRPTQTKAMAKVACKGDWSGYNKGRECQVSAKANDSRLRPDLGLLTQDVPLLPLSADDVQVRDVTGP